MSARAVVVSITLLAGLGAAAVLSTAHAQTRPETKGETVEYDVDPVHSAIIFRVKHLGVSYFYGRINGPYGEFRFNPDDPSACALEVKVKAKNVDTNNPNRDGHIKSADFLNAKQFPEITFKSTAFNPSGNKTYKVTGDLTLHGVTKRMTVELEHVGTKELPRFGHRCGFSTSFTISRSEFGVNYMPEGLGDEVVLMIGLEGKKK
ncbi:MAG: YceI family protein [Planctomycetota bacterium]|jgi:polyisoprenoid-binding protein YceI